MKTSQFHQCYTDKKNSALAHDFLTSFQVWLIEGRKCVTTKTCLYDHIKLATDVIPGSDYSIFKKGIRPMWEDKMNEKGGRWIIKLDRPRAGDLNEMWLDVIMLMIGERFHENEDEICGAILNVRARCDKISVWTSNIKKKKNIMQIGRKLKDCLNYTKDLKLHYESHESVEKKTTKNRYLYTL